MSSVNIYTDGGAKLYDTGFYGGYGAWVETPDESYLLYGSGGKDCTSNRAELLGYIEAQREVQDKGYKDTTFHLDSTYVINHHSKYLDGWKRNNYMTKQGTPVKNQDLWMEVDKVQSNARSNGYKYSLVKVKGHDGIVGNEEADCGATAGRILAYDESMPYGEVLRDDMGFYQREEKLKVAAPLTDAVAESIEKEEPPKKVRKEKVIPANAFWWTSKLLDITNRPLSELSDGRSYYMTVNYDSKAKSGDDDDDEDTTAAKKDIGKTRALGMPHPDAVQGVVLCNNRCEVYDAIREKQNEVIDNDLENPFVIEWRDVKSKARWEAIRRGETGELTSSRHNVYMDDEVTQLTYNLAVPRLARDMIASCDSLYMTLEQFEQGKLDDVSQDITDIIFNVNDKGKVTKRKAADFGKTIIIGTTYEGMELDVRLHQGIHIPDINAFNRMLVQEGDLKVYLVKLVCTPVSFRHAIIVVGEENTGIWNAPISSIRLVPNKKELAKRKK